MDALPSLDTTFGAMLVGTYLAAMVFGLTTHQTYRYFRLYPADDWGLKGMVIVLWVLDSFHTILNLHYCYFYLVSNYFNPEGLVNAIWSYKLVVAVSSCVSLISHLFLTRRVFLLGHNVILTAILIFMAVGRLGFGITLTTEAFLRGTFANFNNFVWLTATTLGFAAVSDVLITIALCHSLHKNRTGYRRTDSLIDILMIYTINTGLLTTLTTIAAVICAAALPKTLIFFAIYIVVSKLYTNSLLAVLNSRRSLMDRGAEGFETGSFGLKNRAELRWEVPASVKHPGMPSPLGVVVTTETFQQVDSEDRTKIRDVQMRCSLDQSLEG